MMINIDAQILSIVGLAILVAKNAEKAVKWPTVTDGNSSDSKQRGYSEPSLIAQHSKH